MDDKEIKRYLRKLEKKLSFAENKKEIVLQTEERIKEYIRHNPDATEEDILDEYGTPEDQVNKWISQTPRTRNLIQKQKNFKIILAGILAVSLILLITIGLGLIDGWSSGSLDNPFTGDIAEYAPVYEATTNYLQ